MISLRRHDDGSGSSSIVAQSLYLRLVRLEEEGHRDVSGSGGFVGGWGIAVTAIVLAPLGAHSQIMSRTLLVLILSIRVAVRRPWAE